MRMTAQQKCSGRRLIAALMFIVGGHRYGTRRCAQVTPALTVAAAIAGSSRACRD